MRLDQRSEGSWVLEIRAGTSQMGTSSVAQAELVGALGEEKGVGRGIGCQMWFLCRRQGEGLH